jgi:hypothetical protein
LNPRVPAALTGTQRDGIQGDYNVGEQLIAALPNEDDPAYKYENDLAQNVSAVGFIGKSYRSKICL